jgi:hypothetical protein
MFWHIAAANKRKTVLLVTIMGVLLAALGFTIGRLGDIWSGFISGGQGADNPMLAGLIGMMIALMAWLGLLITSLLGSDRIFLSLSGAREVTMTCTPSSTTPWRR